MEIIANVRLQTFEKPRRVSCKKGPVNKLHRFSGGRRVLAKDSDQFCIDKNSRRRKPVNKYLVIHGSTWSYQCVLAMGFKVHLSMYGPTITIKLGLVIKLNLGKNINGRTNRALSKHTLSSRVSHHLSSSFINFPSILWFLRNRAYYDDFSAGCSLKAARLLSNLQSAHLRF